MEHSRSVNSMLNLLTGTASRLLQTVLRFVVRTIFIYTLGKAYLGINSYFYDVLSMLSLAEFGFASAIHFRLYKPLAEKNDKRVRVLLKFYKLAYGIVGISILLIGLSLIPFLPVLIKDYDKLSQIGINAPLVFVIYLLQTVSSYLFFAYRSAVMRANQKKYILDISDFVITILLNASQIAVLLLWHNYIAYITTAIAFNVISNMVKAYIAWRFYPQFFKPEQESLSKEEIKDLFKDCGAIFLYKVNNIVLKATDNIVIGFFLGMSYVGSYSNYLLFYRIVTGTLSQIYNSVQASMGNLFAVADIKNKYRFFETMNFLTIVAYGTFASVIAVCVDEIIFVWIGKEYVLAKPFAILIGIEIIFNGIKHNLGQIRAVSGIFKQGWFRPIIGMAVNLSVSIALVQYCGIYGVIIGTISADIIANFLIDPYLIHKHSFQNYKSCLWYYKKNIIYISILSVFCFFNVKICEFFFNGHGWWSAIIHVIIVSVSTVSAFLLIYRNTYECQYLLMQIKKILKKLSAKYIAK